MSGATLINTAECVKFAYHHIAPHLASLEKAVGGRLLQRTTSRFFSLYQAFVLNTVVATRPFPRVAPSSSSTNTDGNHQQNCNGSAQGREYAYRAEVSIPRTNPRLLVWLTLNTRPRNTTLDPNPPGHLRPVECVRFGPPKCISRAVTTEIGPRTSGSPTRYLYSTRWCASLPLWLA